MGGRGAYSEGKANGKDYTYKTVDVYEGIKILQPVNGGSFSMPAEAHPSEAYIVLDRDKGWFRQYREYNKDHLATFEIGYHEEGGLSEKGENVFHIHEYSQPGIDYRGKARPMTPEEIDTYKHLFKGISQTQIDTYLDMYRRRFL